MSFGNRLKEARMSLQITQSELGKLSGLQASAISHFELGTRSPSLKNIVKLCKALNCSPNDLIKL